MFYTDWRTGTGIMPFLQSTMPYQSGVVSWDGSNKKFVVTDPVTGTKSDIYPSTATIELDPETVRIIDWAKKKMEEEKRLEMLCQQYPGLKEAKEQFEIMQTLCK